MSAAAAVMILAVVLIVGYGYYVRRHFRSSGEKELEAEASSEIKPLHVWRLWGRIRSGLAPWTKDTSSTAPFVQVVLALGCIIGGAELFIDAVSSIGGRFNVPPLAFTLLVAPVATELPEKFNSVLWVRRRKDTLALGNMTGAMVFQSSFPVTVGLLLTPWHLAHEALVAAVVALVAGSVLWLTIRFRGSFSGPLLLLQGAFLVLTLSVIFFNLVADLLYFRLDPRIRYA